MKPTKTVKVGDTECLVQTLREWLNWRITAIRRQLRRESNFSVAEYVNNQGRLTELLIIREKINDKRIQGIE